MAKILTTAIVADIRNKLNGSVFSKNRYGSYMRTKVTPVNPQTTAQQAVRNRLATNSQAWRGLTEEQRQGWISSAAAFPTTDIFGNPKILSGSALFVSLNNNLANVGATEIQTAPSPTSIPAFSGLSISSLSDAPEVAISWTSGVLPDDFALVVEATPSVGPGISFVKNRYRFITALPDADASPTAITAAYTAVHGNPLVGNKVFVRCYFVSTITGQAGIPVSAMSIVVAV